MHAPWRQATPWVVLLGLMLGALAVLPGRESPAEEEAGKKSGTIRPVKPQGSLSPKKPQGPKANEEEPALAFVQQHLPELARLLRRLKQIDPKQYRRALVELNRQRRRLENWQRRNPKRYRLELSAWKAQQQAQLLAARLAMDPGNEQLQRQLREAIQQQIRSRRQLLQMEKAQVEKRLQRIERSLRYWSDPQRTDKLYRSLLHSAGKAKGSSAGARRAKKQKQPATRDK